MPLCLDGLSCPARAGMSYVPGLGFVRHGLGMEPGLGLGLAWGGLFFTQRTSEVHAGLGPICILGSADRKPRRLGGRACPQIMSSRSKSSSFLVDVAEKKSMSSVSSSG